MRVKAIEKMYYGRQDRLPGEEYEMDDREESEAKILAALGKIEILKAEVAAASTAPTYRVAAMKAEESEPEPPAPGPMTTENVEALVPRRRQYRRRDMKAEE